VNVVSQADGGLGSVEDPSIAVVPFMNNSTDPEYDYFADGLADELIHALSRAAGK
jgi:TolB-like protein